jgi:nucleoid-associated protein
MTIKHCSIHKIQRNKPGGEVSLQLRPNELKSEGPVVSLFEQLKLSFQRNTQKEYGLFNPQQSDNPLPALLQKTLSQSLGFSSLTHQLMAHLKLQLEKTQEPFNAHILMVIDELVEQQFFYLFWLTHTDAQYVNTELEVDTLEYINPGKLNFAFKIDIEQWKVEGWDQYMTHITARGNRELSEAFSNFSGFISSVNLKEQTENFLAVVDDFIDHQDPGISQQLKSKIVEYCIDQDMSGNPVDIEQLSSQLNDEKPDEFARFVMEKTPETKKEIYTDRASLKKYVRFFGRDKNLSISFSSEMIGENIVFDESEDQLIVKQIPKSLKAQLTRYLKRKHQDN